MSELAPETLRRLEATAHAHGFSLAAALCLYRALVAGGGMAQFSHAELGGLGQWAGGDMIMIGEMGNPELRRRVGVLCVELAALQPGSHLEDRGLAADRDAGLGASTPAASPLGNVPAWTAPRLVDAPATVSVSPAAC